MDGKKKRHGVKMKEGGRKGGRGCTYVAWGDGRRAAEDILGLSRQAGVCQFDVLREGGREGREGEMGGEGVAQAPHLRQMMKEEREAGRERGRGGREEMMMQRQTTLSVCVLPCVRRTWHSPTTRSRGH